MHPRNNQLLANGPYFCLTPIYPLPPCAFLYSEGSFISLCDALSPVTWVLLPHSFLEDMCLFPSLFSASLFSRGTVQSQLLFTRSSHSTWQQKRKAFEVVSRKEQGPSWDSGVCFLSMDLKSGVAGGSPF